MSRFGGNHVPRVLFYPSLWVLRENLGTRLVLNKFRTNPPCLGYLNVNPGIKKQTVDKVFDVIINFIYWEFHIYTITEIYYKMKPLLASLLNL